MLDEYVTSRLRGRRVLIVEDDYFQAQDLAELMAAHDAVVLGPVPSVEDGLGVLLEAVPDLAILDVRLGREMVFPLVEALGTLGVPLVLATACPDWSLPEPYGALPHCEKPLDHRELLRALAALSRAR